MIPLLIHCVQASYAVTMKGISASGFAVEVKASQISGRYSLYILLLLATAEDAKKLGSSMVERNNLVSSAVYAGMSPDDKTILSAIGSVLACVKLQSKAENQALLLSNSQTNLDKLTSMQSCAYRPTPIVNAIQPVTSEVAIQFVATCSSDKHSAVLGGTEIAALSGNFDKIFKCDAGGDGKKECQSFLESFGATFSPNSKFTQERKSQVCLFSWSVSQGSNLFVLLSGILVIGDEPGRTKIQAANSSGSTTIQLTLILRLLDPADTSIQDVPSLMKAAKLLSKVLHVPLAQRAGKAAGKAGKAAGKAGKAGKAAKKTTAKKKPPAAMKNFFVAEKDAAEEPTARKPAVKPAAEEPAARKPSARKSPAKTTKRPDAKKQRLLESYFGTET